MHVWSLFCSIRVYKKPVFCTYSFQELVFRLSEFCVIMCFKFDVILIGFIACVIIAYMGASTL